MTDIDQCILRSIRGENGNLEERRLRDWRNASPENEKRYQELLFLWRLSPREPSEEIPLRPSLDAVVRIAEARRKARVPDWRRRLRTAGRAAAVAAALAVGFGLSESWERWRGGVDFGAVEFTTGPAEAARVTLTDGTFVRLAPESRLRILSNGRHRELWLEGTGFFAVAHHAKASFVVRTPAGDAVALGTRFEVRAHEGDMRVLVTEGTVALQAGTERVEVRASEMGNVRAGADPSVVRVDGVHRLLEWPGGLLVFQATPLSEVARDLEHHFGMRFEFRDLEVSQRSVTGWFADESPEEVVTAVCLAASVRCSVEDRRIVVTKR